MEPNQPQVQPTPPQAAQAVTTPAPTVAVIRPPEQVISELRARVTSGQQLSREEVREALAALRQNRMTAAEAKGGKKAPAAPARSASDLLAKLKSTPVAASGEAPKS